MDASLAVRFLQHPSVPHCHRVWLAYYAPYAFRVGITYLPWGWASLLQPLWPLDYSVSLTMAVSWLISCSRPSFLVSASSPSVLSAPSYDPIQSGHAHSGLSGITVSACALPHTYNKPSPAPCPEASLSFLIFFPHTAPSSFLPGDNKLSGLAALWLSRTQSLKKGGPCIPDLSFNRESPSEPEGPSLFPIKATRGGLGGKSRKVAFHASES